FYQVESERDSLVEYQVKWSRERGFTCTCPAGAVGFSNCRDGVCKHVRWSLAAAKEERDHFAALETASHTPVAQAAQPWTPEERRDYNLNAQRARGADAIVAAIQMARNPRQGWQ